MNTRNSKFKLEVPRVDADKKSVLESKGRNKVQVEIATGVLGDENEKSKGNQSHSARPSRSRKKKNIQKNNNGSKIVESKLQQEDKNETKILGVCDEPCNTQLVVEDINKENQDKSATISKSRSSISLTRDLANLCVQDTKGSSPKVVSPIQKQKILGKSDSSPSINKKPLVNQRRQSRRPKIDATNHKITEYYQVRKSDRKCKTSLEYEKMRNFEMKIINKIKDFEGKGRGIITTREFHKGEFVVEYIGDLIDKSAAREREAQYAKNKKIGCYMYYFKHRDSQYCIDATEESDRYGRLINHSRKGNLISRVFDIGQEPHLVLLAKVDIPAGTEVLYDYGERDPETIQNHPWLNL
ncbi:hypothetical protein QAD02_016955 [Eretmocerus hayati]|uniref:Uncharacterized protein n=1 Tax=Eretmocerus hayati TaxID=131215 RepID=A0ACC2PDJ3_9HYME|nr:hypothetical protein QAD02_016955 [Eretmocerus hayati]